MDVTPLISRDRQVIQSYGGGVFRVSGKIYEGAVAVLPDAVHPWSVASFDPAALTTADFAQPLSLSQGIDVILFGMGDRARPLDPHLKSALAERGVKPDIMDTGAACRTYNVLLAEGRRVMALLLPVEKKS